MSEMTVQDAEQEAREAEQLAATLEERVKAGDESVTAEEIEAQKSLARFARLRVEAAGRKAAQRRAQDARDRCEQFASDLLTATHSADHELVETWLELAGALLRMQEVANHRATLVLEQSNKALSYDGLLRRDAGTSLQELGVYPSAYGDEKGYRIPSQGISIAHVPLSRLVSAAAAVALHPNVRGEMSSSIRMEAGDVDRWFSDRIHGWTPVVKDVKAPEESLRAVLEQREG